jgi:Tol biopolymer transport system component
MKKIINALILFILFAVFFFIGVFLSPKVLNSSLIFKSGVVPSIISDNPSACPEKSCNGTTISWEKPQSNVRGYPIVDDLTGKLYVYDLSSKKLKETAFYSQYLSGAMGLGTADPRPSSDGTYTVFLQKDKKGLFLLSNETLQLVEVPHTKSAVYITDWFKNNKRFIYYSDAPTVKSAKEGMVPYEEPATFEKSAVGGFFMFDIDTGETTPLNQLSNVEAIMDEHRILTKFSQGQDYNADRFVIFDADKFSADYSTVKDDFKFGAGQFTFSDDGKKWAFSYSEDVKSVEMIFDNFPVKKGKVIETGSWAGIQLPFVSPDGTKIIYQKTIGQLEPGSPREATILYDSKTEKNEQLYEGLPLAWLDTNTVVVKKLSVPNNKEKSYVREYFLIDVNSKEVTKMY